MEREEIVEHVRSRNHKVVRLRELRRVDGPRVLLRDLQRRRRQNGPGAEFKRERARDGDGVADADGALESREVGKAADEDRVRVLHASAVVDLEAGEVVGSIVGREPGGVRCIHLGERKEAAVDIFRGADDDGAEAVELEVLGDDDARVRGGGDDADEHAFHGLIRVLRRNGQTEDRRRRNRRDARARGGGARRHLERRVGELRAAEFLENGALDVEHGADGRLRGGALDVDALGRFHVSVVLAVGRLEEEALLDDCRDDRAADLHGEPR
mmetsp:Transcript_29285/g.98691  ORF Transcript_29285/g.98691 Transcript_29285/m.98691 type:complete len:270 (-) Transcript_29285:701-1510(-)